MPFRFEDVLKREKVYHQNPTNTLDIEKTSDLPSPPEAGRRQIDRLSPLLIAVGLVFIAVVALAVVLESRKGDLELGLTESHSSTTKGKHCYGIECETGAGTEYPVQGSSMNTTMTGTDESIEPNATIAENGTAVDQHRPVSDLRANDAFATDISVDSVSRNVEKNIEIN
ncbi:uncharacterized protein LOC135383896 [Ornithodoros turicata]|uniref:uncharacterized protein LOC135383896 n=1 Tax=Ornithodoros turicata TaxID=34597 RepID=UPI003139D142